MTALGGRGYTVTSPSLNWVLHACTQPSSHVRNNANFNFDFKTYFGINFKYKMFLKHKIPM
jgi:hypothetical protein